MNVFSTVEFDDQHTAATISIDKAIYSKSAVLKACYWFSKDLHFQIEDKKDHFRLTMAVRVVTPTLECPKIKKIDEWLPEVLDALLDSQLRVEIQTETAAVRELIIAKAFAESGVLEDAPPGVFNYEVPSEDNGSNGLVTITTKVRK
jgi:His-Xaa-Ser system protein HxsD